MINKVHIIGMGLMGTNLGIKLVEKGLQVSGDDTSKSNLDRAKKYDAINLNHNLDTEYDLTVLAMPINGLSKSSSDKPMACSMAWAAGWESSFVTTRLNLLYIIFNYMIKLLPWYHLSVSFYII